MPTRKHFIAAAASVPLLAAAPAPPSPEPTAPSAPSPKPSPTKKKISPAARELAARMRAFDPSLSDKELENIASGIEDNLNLGKQVNPKGRAIKNWDEPLVAFEVTP